MAQRRLNCTKISKIVLYQIVTSFDVLIMLIIKHADYYTKMRRSLSQCDIAYLLMSFSISILCQRVDIPPFSREFFHIINQQFSRDLFLAHLTHITHCARNTLVKASVQGGNGLRIVTSTLFTLIWSEVVQEIITS